MLNGKSITGHSYITGEFGHIRLPVDALEVVWRDFRCCAAAAVSWAVLKIISPVAVSPGCTNIFISNRSPRRRFVAQWQQHDPRAQAHVERYLDLLAVCLGNILTIVDPDLLVLGGGLSNFTAISEGLAQRLPRHLLPVARVPRIERARHGDAGGMARVRPSFT
ncbi:N-acetyl-D-glucosamine kinase [Klebsiella pneumoniae subsp. ozaenae]|uniref:N-acetyl-D-glucosamine kinase n=1 Tax=Klebsiella pneumoniae subsp. ozaenae TaxID=574 RepID=A0A377ZD92_KLEPO|nr:N-acetyl-D-glucosamine kinase [Klebsiella pneumoniae subsp. ozaenae]